MQTQTDRQSTHEVAANQDETALSCYKMPSHWILMLKHSLMTHCSPTLADMLVEGTSRCHLLETESLMTFDVFEVKNTVSTRNRVEFYL